MIIYFFRFLFVPINAVLRFIEKIGSAFFPEYDYYANPMHRWMRAVGKELDIIHKIYLIQIDQIKFLNDRDDKIIDFTYSLNDQIGTHNSILTSINDRLTALENDRKADQMYNKWFDMESTLDEEIRRHAVKDTKAISRLEENL